MSITQTNIMLKYAKIVKYRITDIAHDTYTLHINASNAEEMYWSGESETILFFSKAQLQELAETLNKVLVPEITEDTCESCEKTKDICDCVPCNSCGHDTAREDIYMGYCPSCEDQRMVRNIR